MEQRILIIDDNPTNLKLAADVLKFEGFVVAKAEDAVRALQVLAGFQPHLILMDIAMPGMDGLALTRQLKSDPAFASVPIVALTASAMKGDDLRVLEAGCDGYITKPIDTRTFCAQIADFLHSSAGLHGSDEDSDR